MAMRSDTICWVCRAIREGDEESRNHESAVMVKTAYHEAASRACSDFRLLTRKLGNHIMYSSMER